MPVESSNDEDVNVELSINHPQALAQIFGVGRLGMSISGSKLGENGVVALFFRGQRALFPVGEEGVFIGGEGNLPVGLVCSGPDLSAQADMSTLSRTSPVMGL